MIPSRVTGSRAERILPALTPLRDASNSSWATLDLYPTVALLRVSTCMRAAAWKFKATVACALSLLGDHGSKWVTVIVGGQERRRGCPGRHRSSVLVRAVESLLAAPSGSTTVLGWAGPSTGALQVEAAPAPLRACLGGRGGRLDSSCSPPAIGVSHGVLCSSSEPRLLDRRDRSLSMLIAR